MNKIITEYSLYIINFIFPSIIILGLYKKDYKIKFKKSIWLLIVITIINFLTNYFFKQIIAGMIKPSFFSTAISNMIFSIPITLYILYSFKIKTNLKKKKEYNKTNIIAYIIIFIVSLLLSYVSYYLYFFEFTVFDNTLYTLLTPVVDTGLDVFIHSFIYVTPILIFTYMLFLIPISNRGIKVLLKYKNKQYQLLPVKFFMDNKIKYSLILLLFIAIYAMYRFFVFDYILSLNEKTTIYEDYFVESEKVKITFPEKKKNLIYIMVESLESTTLSYENGGYFKESITPELEEIALNNINFSQTDLLGGFSVPASCGWTIAGVVCQTSGIPLKTSFRLMTYDSLIPKATTMWDILDDNDYNLKVVMGSNAKFAKTRVFFNDHKVNDIVDYKEIIKRDNLPKNYKVWWGVEDRKLFARAKSEITDLSKNNKPFAVLISTMDTHFPDGYKDKKCVKREYDRYLNSYSCESILINDFVNWAKEQPFYKDTVIVIVGDHLSMQRETFKHVPASERYVYNAFINTDININININNINNRNRKFNSFDIYPTILVSIGANIEGNRLGFGTNLFSKEQTLTEKLGHDEFNKSIYKKSEYYERFY